MSQVRQLVWLRRARPAHSECGLPLSFAPAVPSPIVSRSSMSLMFELAAKAFEATRQLKTPGIIDDARHICGKRSIRVLAVEPWHPFDQARQRRDLGEPARII